MPSVLQILEQRQVRQDRRQRDIKPRLALFLAILLSLGLALFALWAAIVYNQASQDLPSIEKLPAFFEPPDGLFLQPTRFLDRSGEHVILVVQNPRFSSKSTDPEEISAYRRGYWRVQTGAQANSTQIKGEPLPDSVVLTTIAAADPEFRKHPGVTLQSILNPKQPTLAQQLVLTTLLSGEPSSSHKEIRSWLLAVQATTYYGRDKILEWYLNSAAYGRFSYGIDEAARLYFDKKPADLSLAEAALLAGVSQSPNLNPHDAPQAALERQKKVIQEMLRLRMLLPEEGLQATAEVLQFTPIEQVGRSLLISDLQPGLAGAFVNLAVAELDPILPRDQLERGGYRVITTLDFQLQQQANCLVSPSFFTQDEDLVIGQVGQCPISSFIEPVLELPDTVESEFPVEFLVLNPQNGQVLALATNSPIAAPTGDLAKHPAGSLATPFVYLAAFTRGMSPASLVWDTPTEAAGEVHNLDNRDHGPRRFRLALANDYLVATQKILEQVGVQNAQQIANQFGLPSSQTGNHALPTSANLISDLDIFQASRAFGVLANQGTLSGKEAASLPESSSEETDLSAYSSILKIDSLQPGQVYPMPGLSSRPIISPQLAYLINHVLSDDPAHWESQGHPNPLETGYPLAVKSSQTLDNTSHWVIGYTADRVISLWLGAEEFVHNNTDLPATYPATIAANLWRAMAIPTLENLKTAEPFPVPTGITTLTVCDPSGMLPGDACPNTVNEVFIAGNEPLQVDSLYQELAVNRETNQLATVLTPADLIEKRVFMIPPEDERAWTLQAGISLAPSTYDLIPAIVSNQADVRLSSPLMFEKVRGVVLIQGILPEGDFDFARIQIGKGVNPETWFQVGDDFLPPFSDPLQVNWDTEGLDGLYAIQLMAVRPDQSILKAFALTTVDNQAPQVTIQQPFHGQVISAQDFRELIFQAGVQDNVGIQVVEFILDKQLIASCTVGPYIAAWKPTPGEHSLVVIAIDQAGNQSSIQTDFIIN